MANLKRRFAFKRWVPDIGDNREQEPKNQLALELAVHLTTEQMEELDEALTTVPSVDYSDLEEAFTAAADDEARREINRKSTARMLDTLRDVRVKAFEPYVRIVGGPHTINGAPLNTVADYIGFAGTSRDGGTLMVGELLAALRAFNSLSGADEVFSVRRSGGSASTGTPSVVKDSAPTGGQ